MTTGRATILRLRLPLALLAAAALSACANAPVPVNYAPSSVMSANGALSVAEFRYLPTEKAPKDRPAAANQIPNTAMGEIIIDREVKAFVRDAVFAELRFLGIKTNDPNLEKFFGSAVGYAIFPSVGKGAFVVGGAAGTGCLYEGGAIIGQAKLGQVTVGLQLGGQSYAEVIFFQNRDAIDAFKGNSFELSAQVSAVAAASGASANAKYRLGVLVFTLTKTGLMYEASVGGQKFTFKPLAADSSPKPPDAGKPKD